MSGDLTTVDVEARIRRLATDPNGLMVADQRTRDLVEMDIDALADEVHMSKKAIRARHAYVLAHGAGILGKQVVEENDITVLPLYLRVREEEAKLHGTDAKSGSDGVQFNVIVSPPAPPVPSVGTEPALTAEYEEVPAGMPSNGEGPVRTEVDGAV